MQRNGGSSRFDMDTLLPPSADGGRYVTKAHRSEFRMFNWLYRWWTYSAYDANGKLKMLTERAPDPTAFNCVDAFGDDIQRTLAMICDSFDIDLTQQFCLRPKDNLADIYRAMTKYRIGDDMEYERLLMALTNLVGEFDTAELTNDINVTVQEVIEFVSRKLKRTGVT